MQGPADSGRGIGRLSPADSEDFRTGARASAFHQVTGQPGPTPGLTVLIEETMGSTRLTLALLLALPACRAVPETGAYALDADVRSPRMWCDLPPRLELDAVGPASSRTVHLQGVSVGLEDAALLGLGLERKLLTSQLTSSVGSALTRFADVRVAAPGAEPASVSPDAICVAARLDFVGYDVA